MLKHNDWFIPFKQEKNAYLRLFCFHYSGGSASAFRQWSTDVIGDVELIAIQLPGREERFNEPLLNNISQIVNNLCWHFNNYLDKPFIFFGHSTGALIAFEFVRALRRKGMPKPEHLVISGTKAPQVPLKKQPIHDLPNLKFIEELKKYNGIADYIIENEELMSIFMPTIRADFCISETYKYTSEEPLTCPMTVLGGLSDDTVDLDDLIQWKEQTSSLFKYHLLFGDHFFVNTSYEEVIKIVNQILYNEIIKFVRIN
jgi:medium-chain acyl-[acyl-carrier-protein] hydrolase